MRLLNWLKSLFTKKPVVIQPKEVVQTPIAPFDPHKITEKPKDWPDNGLYKSIDLEVLRPEYEYKWLTYEFDTHTNLLVKVAVSKILSNKAQYLEVQKYTNVPWFLIAAIHYRESDLDFSTCLHNGDPLPGPTVHVPRNRGPFKSWAEAAIDALHYDDLAGLKDWDLGKVFWYAENFNGFGYRNHGFPSAYVFAGTQWYDSGLYVADGKFDPTVRDLRPGVMAILKGLEQRNEKIFG